MFVKISDCFIAQNFLLTNFQLLVNLFQIGIYGKYFGLTDYYKVPQGVKRSQVSWPIKHLYYDRKNGKNK